MSNQIKPVWENMAIYCYLKRIASKLWGTYMYIPGTLYMKRIRKSTILTWKLLLSGRKNRRFNGLSKISRSFLRYAMYVLIA